MTDRTSPSAKRQSAAELADLIENTVKGTDFEPVLQDDDWLLVVDALRSVPSHVALPAPTIGEIGGLWAVWINPAIGYVWGFNGKLAKSQAESLAEGIKRHLDSFSAAPTERKQGDLCPMCDSPARVRFDGTCADYECVSCGVIFGLDAIVRINKALSSLSATALKGGKDG